MKQKKDKEFWENKFESEGVAWKFEPADSALKAQKLFTIHKIIKILIPGAGYGRNAQVFVKNGFVVTGIEVSKTAIQLAKENGLHFKIHHGSVMDMPFDDEEYDGIFCYALLHLLNKRERKAFLKSCFAQLRVGGIMVFVVVSDKASMYGQGKKQSNNRYRLNNGLNVYFYDSDAVKNEFEPFGLTEFSEIDEPIKHIDGFEPLKFFYIVCRKPEKVENES